MPTVFITGGGGEIGSAIVEKFSEKGYQIIAPTSKILNLAQVNSIHDFMQSLRQPIDIFIHCAGFNIPKSAGELSLEDLNQTLQINVVSFYAIVCSLLTQFKQRKSGYILGISSLYGVLARKNRLAYVASKHALNGMIKTLALELGQYNIQSNGIAPGFVNTKMTRKNNDAATIDGFIKKIPLGRLATTQDIARVAYFLCSEENTYINGEIINVDGGYSQGGFQE